MPLSNVMEMLVRKGPVSDAMWLDLVQARRDLIKPHLEKLPLDELGSVKCLQSEHHEMELSSSCYLAEDSGKKSLKIQGIFGLQPWKAIERIPNSGYPPAGALSGTLRIWGLKRSGAWMVATVNFIGDSGYKNRGRTWAESIDVAETDLPTMVALTKENPETIWGKLGAAVHDWARRRQQLYHQAQQLSCVVQVDDEMLRLTQIEDANHS